MTGRSAVFWASAFAVSVCVGLEGLPEPDPTIRFTCPNHSQIYVMDAHWDSAKRTKRITKVLPATCGDTTSVTYGYLR